MVVKTMTFVCPPGCLTPTAANGFNSTATRKSKYFFCETALSLVGSNKESIVYSDFTHNLGGRLAFWNSAGVTEHPS